MGRPNTRLSSGTFQIGIFQRRARSFWFRTISARIPRPRCTPPTRRLAERFEHYTPKHGSWLDLAESEVGVLSSQCLDRRIEHKDCLIGEVAAWQQHRNKHHAKANWQFTNEKARIKLKRLYPSLFDSGD